MTEYQPAYTNEEQDETSTFDTFMNRRNVDPTYRPHILELITYLQQFNHVMTPEDHEQQQQQITALTTKWEKTLNREEIHLVMLNGYLFSVMLEKGYEHSNGLLNAD